MQPIYKTDIFLFFVSFYHIASQFSTETNIRTERCASTTYPTLRPNASFFRFLCAAGDTNVTEILSLHRYGADARTAVPRGTAEETGQTLKHYSHVSKTILPGPRTLRSDGLHRLRQRGGNQPGPDTDPVTPTENTVDVAYAIGGGADFLLIFDAEVKYTDATGKTATEKISSLPWSKELTGLALPYTAKMEITLTARESYEEKEQYELGFGHAISYETSDGRTYGGLNVSKQTVGKDKIAKYQELMLSKSLQTTIEIPAK